MDRIEPAEPIDKIEPVDPIDRIEPLEPMDKIEPAEPAERAESSSMRTFSQPRRGLTEEDQHVGKAHRGRHGRL
jgi:hypothetical protein